MSKKPTRAELERDVTRLEKQVTELQELSTAQVEKNRSLFAQVCDRTEVCMLMMQACCQVGTKDERLYVYGPKNAIDRVRSLVGQLGLQAMKQGRHLCRTESVNGAAESREEKESHASSAHHR